MVVTDWLGWAATVSSSRRMPVGGRRSCARVQMAGGDDVDSVQACWWRDSRREHPRAGGRRVGIEARFGA